MIQINKTSKKKYTVNGKLVKIKKGFVNYLDNFTNLEKETFVKYYKNLK